MIVLKKCSINLITQRYESKAIIQVRGSNVACRLDPAVSISLDVSKGKLSKKKLGKGF